MQNVNFVCIEIRKLLWSFILMNPDSETQHINITKCNLEWVVIGTWYHQKFRVRFRDVKQTHPLLDWLQIICFFSTFVSNVAANIDIIHSL